MLKRKNEKPQAPINLVADFAGASMFLAGCFMKPQPDFVCISGPLLYSLKLIYASRHL